MACQALPLTRFAMQRNRQTDRQTQQTAEVSYTGEQERRPNGLEILYSLIDPVLSTLKSFFNIVYIFSEEATFKKVMPPLNLSASVHSLASFVWNELL